MPSTPTLVYLAHVFIGLVLVFGIIPAYSPPADEYGLSPALLPTLFATGMLIISSLQLLGIFFRKTSTNASPGFNKNSVFNFLVFISILFFTVFLMEKLGYVLAGLICIIGLQLLFKQRNALKIFLISSLTVGILYALVTYVLRIPLP